MMNTIISLIAAAVTFGTVLMYGTLGEVLTERSGNLTKGIYELFISLCRPRIFTHKFICMCHISQWHRIRFFLPFPVHIV